MNVIISKVVRIGKNREENVLDIQLHDCRMKEVDCYRLDVDKSSDGRMYEEVSHRIGEVRKASGPLQTLWRNTYVKASEGENV